MAGSLKAAMERGVENQLLLEVLHEIQFQGLTLV